MTNRKTEFRRLEDLKDHPRQQELAGEISEAALEELVHDMGDRGLQQPIEILPDNIIVCGHQRVRAARMLNWKTIDVIVRDDLGDVNDPRVIRHLVADNTIRRQGDVIAIARAYRALKELEQGRKWDDLRHDDRRDTRDRIGEVLGMTGRNLDRLEQLLDLPRPIQDAVSRKELTQTAALKIGELSENEQQEIATAITSATLENCRVKDVVRSFLESDEDDLERLRQIYAGLTRQLERAANDLLPYLDDVAGTLQDGRAVAMLDRGIDLLEDLRERELEVEKRAIEECASKGDECV